MTDAPKVNESLPIATNLNINFVAVYSAKITTTGTSQSITFPAINNTLKGRQTWKITNTSTSNGAYIAFGNGSATAVASGTTPALNCDYIGPGAIITQDALMANGSVADTIAVIQSVAGVTLEISNGFGQ